jgi:hypothetical protein
MTFKAVSPEREDLLVIRTVSKAVIGCMRSGLIPASGSTPPKRRRCATSSRSPACPPRSTSRQATDYLTKPVRDSMARSFREY